MTGELGAPADLGWLGGPPPAPSPSSPSWLSGSGSKGRRFAAGDVFRASRLSSGNRLFPTQVLITPTSVVQYTPRWFGRREETIHMAHIASVKIETGMLLVRRADRNQRRSDPICCHGHGKGDATPDERPHRAATRPTTTGAARARHPGPCRDRPDRPIKPNALRWTISPSARAARAQLRHGQNRRARTPETRFRTLVQSPLRAGLLRYLSARPDESFDVESLMQTFGRLKLDVENCVRELVDFGVARIVPGNAAALSRPSGPPTRRSPTSSITFLERRASGQHRGPVAVGPALPRDDRPRREDARSSSSGSAPPPSRTSRC